MATIYATVTAGVSERVTLVAEQRDRIIAAAHLLRYYLDERAGQATRDVGEIRWLLFWPEAPAGNPCWPDATEAADALMAGCIRQLEQWRVTRQHAGGELPVRGVYGVPEQWPHISAIYQRAGFAGRWLAPRALRALSAWAFDEVDLHRIELIHSTMNPASCRVAARSNYKPEGTKRGEARHADGWHDMHLHARLIGDARPSLQPGMPNCLDWPRNAVLH